MRYTRKPILSFFFFASQKKKGLGVGVGRLEDQAHTYDMMALLHKRIYREPFDNQVRNDRRTCCAFAVLSDHAHEFPDKKREEKGNRTQNFVTQFPDR